MIISILPAMPRLLELAAERHGHFCPSLFYGVRLAVLAVARLPQEALPRLVTLSHTSNCFRDGVLTVLAAAKIEAAVELHRQPGACRLEIGWNGGRVLAEIPVDVRRAVDALHAAVPDLESFREEGLRQLAALDDDRFATFLP